MTAIVRRIDVLQAQLRVILLLAELATPGPWDACGPWVIAPNHVGGFSPGDREYYGGHLICESISSPDAMLVAISRNVVPGLARAHLDLLQENIELRNRNRLLESLASAGQQLQRQLVPAGILTIRSTEDGRVDATRTYVRRFGRFDSIDAALRATEVNIEERL